MRSPCEMLVMMSAQALAKSRTPPERKEFTSFCFDVAAFNHQLVEAIDDATLPKGSDRLADASCQMHLNIFLCSVAQLTKFIATVLQTDAHLLHCRVHAGIIVRGSDSGDESGKISTERHFLGLEGLLSRTRSRECGVELRLDVRQGPRNMFGKGLGKRSTCCDFDYYFMWLQNWLPKGLITTPRIKASAHLSKNHHTG